MLYGKPDQFSILFTLDLSGKLASSGSAQQLHRYDARYLCHFCSTVHCGLSLCSYRANCVKWLWLCVACDLCLCGSRDSSIKCQNKNEIKSNSFLGILSFSPALRIRHVAKQHLSSNSDCSCCSCCWCCLVASERCRKPLNKFNLTASNMQLKRGMQHAALWQEKEENAWHFICLRERRRPWKSNFPRWQ